MNTVALLLITYSLFTQLGNDSYVVRAKAYKEINDNICLYGPYLEDFAKNEVKDFEIRTRVDRLVSHYYEVTAEYKAHQIIHQFNGYVPWLDHMSQATRDKLGINVQYYLDQTNKIGMFYQPDALYPHRWPYYQKATELALVDLCKNKETCGYAVEVANELRINHTKAMEVQYKNFDGVFLYASNEKQRLEQIRKNRAEIRKIVVNHLSGEIR